jgi:glycosyltransferase involved in cell wall biosynthesis
MLVVHRLLRTWRRKVDCFVVPSLSAARRFARGGVPEPKIRVKPAFVHPDPGPCSARGGYALFLGRLSEEKGVRTLLRAWRSTTIPLRIAGAGPLESEVRKTLADGGLRGGEWVGWCDRTRAIALLKGARFLVVPSECDETFGMSVVEAFACGVPVISSRRGALPEINRDGITGLLFDPGEAEDLRAKLEWAWSRPETMDCMGSAARAEFEAKYTGPRNGEMLMDIYRGVVLPTTEGNKP